MGQYTKEPRRACNACRTKDRPARRHTCIQRRGVDDVILDGKRRVEDRPYHASAHTVNHQGGGRANSITPFVVYCTRGSVVIGGRALFSLPPPPSSLSLSLSQPFASFARAEEIACIRSRELIRPTTSVSPEPRGIQIVRAFRVNTRVSWLTSLSRLSGHENPRYPARRFACRRADREAQSDSRLRLLFETARVFPWTGYAPSTYRSCQEVLRASFGAGDLDKFRAVMVILSTAFFS